MLLLVLISSLLTSDSLAAPTKPSPGERVSLFCRDVLSSIRQTLTTDFEEVEIQTSKGLKKVKVMTRVQLGFPLKFATKIIAPDFSNLAPGECGMIDKYFEPKFDSWLYSDLPGDFTLQFNRARVSTNPGPTIDLSVHNVVSSLKKNCQVHFIQADRIGSLDSFRAVVPGSGSFGCAK